jgi:branched-chain amino acid transport system substrate-binding protein
LGIAAAAVAVVGSGLATAASAQGEPDVITIGIDLPLSGPAAEAAKSLQRGFELTAEEINAAGGIDGAEIVLDIQDDEGDPTTGVALVDRFVQNDAVAIIGTYNSPVVLAQAESVAEAEMPQIVYAISQAIADLENPWIFQLGPTDSGQIEGILERMAEAGLSKPAVLTDTSGLGSFALPTIEAALEAAGVEAVQFNTFAPDAADLSSVVLQASNAGADSLIVWTTGPAYATIVAGSSQVGWTGPIFANASAADPSVARLGGDAIEQLFFQDSIDRTKDEVIAVSELWASEFPDGVPSEALAARDMLTMVVDAVTAVGTDRAAIRDYLEQYSSTALLSGSAGSTVQFAPGDHVAITTENIVWKTYRDGEIALADG